jgi:hypothetical protein
MRTPTQIEIAGEIDKLLIQARAITGLLGVVPAKECDMDDEVVTNAAWLLSEMLERIQVLIQETDRMSGLKPDTRDEGDQRHTVPTIKVGWLRQCLNVYPDDFDLSFGGLEFYRVKTRGENIAMVEFNQGVYLDTDGQVVIQSFDHG